MNYAGHYASLKKENPNIQEKKKIIKVNFIDSRL